ncbi:MAG TPA: response regulator [Planctomycetota bacterium]|nr:response regulator [Planctomycetota bacterium]
MTAAATQPPQVLVVEDEVHMQRFLRATLLANGYLVTEATTGELALLHATRRAPDVVVLDLGLPDIDGFEVMQRLRAFTKVPIVVLSARGHEADKVRALDAGADDYLTKPFGVGELLARLRAALRRAIVVKMGGGETVFEHGDLRVDLGARQVLLAGQEVRLTPIEWKMLTVLVANAGRVVTHQQLLQEVWGPQCVEETHYLRVYMSQMRRKLEPDPARPRCLLTEPGVGYRLRADR